MKDISSPCIKHCTYDYSNSFCTGCLRSKEEISKWIYLSEESRLEIMKLIPTRRNRLDNL
ncbi:MAG: DUF1289 domain-containing protein [Dehalococcoidia bacterium]|nr:DUF1289 domain-containing protein [Dehalococcoidia bacterium]